jgi:hypothetical protein
VEAIVWFGFRVLGCRSTAKGAAPWASFRSLGGFEEEKNIYPKTTLWPIGGIKTPRAPLFRLFFFAPLAPFRPWAFYFWLGALVLQLGVGKAVELELRPISDSVRLHMAALPGAPDGVGCTQIASQEGLEAARFLLVPWRESWRSASCRSSKSSRSLAFTRFSLLPGVVYFVEPALLRSTLPPLSRF